MSTLTRSFTFGHPPSRRRDRRKDPLRLGSARPRAPNGLVIDIGSTIAEVHDQVLLWRVTMALGPTDAPLRLGA